MIFLLMLFTVPWFLLLFIELVMIRVFGGAPQSPMLNKYPLSGMG